jgi:hypothetical protein
MSRIQRGVFVTLLLAAALWGKKFYPDDPLWVEPPPKDASGALPRKLSDYYDLFLHTLKKPGERNTRKREIPAQAVNTLGEPMDSGWYTRRHYYKRMSVDELAAGARTYGPPEGRWTVVAAKTEGVTPGFTIVDAKGRRYFIKVDPLTNPEMTTSAEIISARFFHALGYHVAEESIVYFKIDDLELGENVTVADKVGKKRKMTRRDLLEVLLNAPKDGQERYRAVASAQITGKPLGPFRYFGTRKDDPNDITPHEHRRDLRGLSVFCAWLAHDDSRSINTFDVLVEDGGARHVRHYLLDFGSTLGSGSERPNSPRSGGEYLFGWKQSAAQLVTLGLAVPKWARADFPDYPSIGLFEGDKFDPAKWVPEYPNPAFVNRLPADEFWAAKQVMAFTDEEIRAIVATGLLSDQQAEKYLADTLIKRRDKIGRAFFARTLPLDRFRVEGGRLEFDDLARKHNLGAADFGTAWFRFDNETEQRTPLAGETRLELPAEIGRSDSGYWVADLQPAGKPEHRISVYVRKGGGRTDVVGVERAR